MSRRLLVVSMTALALASAASALAFDYMSFPDGRRVRGDGNAATW